MKAKHILTLVALTAIGLAVSMLALRDKTSRPAPSVSAEPASVVPTEPTSVAPDVEARRAVEWTATLEPPPKPIEAPRAGDRGEALLMGNLRELSGSDPVLSLALARQGNERFKDSPAAAERGWIIIRSLANMGRLDDARTEARILVDKYPGTSWADDVHRHLLVHPPSDPSERGYGKATELE